MSKNNQTGVAEDNHYARFEALPRPFRKLLRHASHDLTVGWVEQLIALYGAEAALTEVARRIRQLKHSTILEHYGPAHPQLSFTSKHDRHA